MLQFATSVTAFTLHTNRYDHINASNFKFYLTSNEIRI